MWLVQLPSGMREAWRWPKRVANPFFRCAPPRPPQLRGKGGRVLPRGRGLVWGVGPFRRPAGRFCGAFRSARAVGAGVRARAASRLRPRGSRGVSRLAFCVGESAPVLAGGACGIFWGSVPRGSYALALGSAPAAGSAVSSAGSASLGAPVASGSVSPGGPAFLGAPVVSGSVLPGGACRFWVCFVRGVRRGPCFGPFRSGVRPVCWDRVWGRSAPRFGSRRFSSRGSSLRRRSSPESAVSPRPPSPAPGQEAFWTFCSPFPASEGPRELPSANVDLTAHSFEPALVSEDEEFARDVDSRLLYTD